MSSRYRRSSLPLHDTSLFVEFSYKACSTVNDFVRYVAEKRAPDREDEFLHLRPTLRNPLADYAPTKVALERLGRAARQSEKVWIYSDYDCDGVVSTVLMSHLLRSMGLSEEKILRFTPHRIKHGYGVSKSFLESKIEEEIQTCGTRPDLIIFLDCGSTATEEVRWLLELGLDVIVIDHHFTGKSLFPAPGLIHLNPKSFPDWNGTEQEWEDLKQMCAGGLCCLLILAAIKAEIITDSLHNTAIILGGLATVADVCPLQGINRILTKLSIELCSDPESLQSASLGLHLLHQNSQRPQQDTWVKITEDTFGFFWGPVLNSAGRMTSAKLPVSLLLEKDTSKARKDRNELQKINAWRKATQTAILHAARLQAEKQMRHGQPNVLLLVDETWHLGVVGIVAARIREEFNRPTIVCGSPRPGVWQGSARSVPGCKIGNLFHEAMEKKLIQKGGGHAMAGGLTFSEEQRVELQDWLSKACGLSETYFRTPVRTFVPASAFKPEEWHEIRKILAPFGNGNEEPALLAEKVKLIGVTPLRKRKAEGLGKGVLFGYEGKFFDEITGVRFKASWYDLELADAWWNAGEISGMPYKHRPKPIVPDLFRLELTVVSYTKPLEEAKPSAATTNSDSSETQLHQSAEPEENELDEASVQGGDLDKDDKQEENLESLSKQQPAAQAQTRYFFKIQRCWRFHAADTDKQQRERDSELLLQPYPLDRESAVIPKYFSELRGPEFNFD